MAEGTNKSGGITFGKVGRNVTINAGGDVVGGDKVTTITSQQGFSGEEARRQFEAQLDELRETLRVFKAAVEANSTLSADEKDGVASEILEHVKAIKEAKQRTADVPVGVAAPPEVASCVESTLDRAGTLLQSVEGLTKKAAGLAETVATFVAKFGPLLLSARHLFGLP